jgi:hypothetical protein
MSRARLQEAQKVAGAVIDDADYLTRLKLRAQSGSLPPAIEALLWHYRFGKPVEKISVSEEENLANANGSCAKTSSLPTDERMSKLPLTLLHPFIERQRIRHRSSSLFSLGHPGRAETRRH